MALSENATMLKNLVDPEVIGDLIDKKLVDAIKFAPLAKVDTTLVGQPGSTVKLPSYEYIGDAVVVAEGKDIPIRQLTQTTKEVTIQKIGNGGVLTDEAVLSGYGDPVGEFVDQLVTSIASKVDNDLVTALGSTTTTYSAAGDVVSADDVAGSLALFGEDIDGEKALLVDPATYASLRKSSDWLPASDVAADMFIKGVVGMVQGCQVIVTNRIKDKSAFIVKQGALAIFLKRDVMVESDRDIVNKSTVITADKHLATYLIDETKAIKIAVGAGA